MRRSSRDRAGVALAAALATFALAPGEARAACPESLDEICDSFATGLLPSVAGVAYFPRSGGLGPWIGAGGEVVLFTWSNNSEAFGPGHGKLKFDFEGLASTATGSPPAMIMYRGGVDLAFERNASRSYLIPYFGVSLGGLSQSTLGGTGFVDGELGLYLLYTKRVMIDAEGAFLFPFRSFDTYAGPKTQLTLSVNLW